MGCGSVADYLPSLQEALGLISSTGVGGWGERGVKRKEGRKG